MRQLPRLAEQVSVGQELKVFFMGDLHLGAPDTDYKLIANHIKTVEDDPDARLVFMGDAGEFIDFRDPRFKPDVASKMPRRYKDAHLSLDGGVVQEAIDHACELFERVARQGKVWAWLDGNHEEKVVTKHSFSPGQMMCKELNILSRYVGYGGYVPIHLVRHQAKKVGYTLKLDLHHGWSAGRRDGGTLNAAHTELANTDADVIARGHSHKRGTWAFDAWRVGHKLPIEWQRFFITTGTYKRGHVDTNVAEPPSTTYELRKGFTPKTTANMGGVWLTVSLTSGHDQKPISMSARL